MVLDGSDVVLESEAIRLPNMIRRSSDITMDDSQTGGSITEKEMTMSPTHYLKGSPASPQLKSFVTQR